MNVKQIVEEIHKKAYKNRPGSKQYGTRREKIGTILLNKLIHSYLKGHWIKTENGRMIEMTFRVPQVSVTKPIL